MHTPYLLLMRTIISTSVLFLTSCASHQKPCEDINEINQQTRMCSDLRKVMQDRNHPQQALTARKRFEEACVNLRYYRDEYDTVCKAGANTKNASTP